MDVREPHGDRVEFELRVCCSINSGCLSVLVLSTTFAFNLLLLRKTLAEITLSPLSPYYSEMLFLLFAVIRLASALPWNTQPGGEAPCSTSCLTSVCTESSTTEVPLTEYITKTTCVASTLTSDVPYFNTETYTSTVSSTVTVSYATTIWITTTSVSLCPEVYYSTCTETSQTLIPTSVCSNTVCPEITQVPSTIEYYSTQTTCQVQTATWSGEEWCFDDNWNWESGWANSWNNKINW